MLIQINTDKNIEGTTEMISHFTTLIQDQLQRFDEHITRIVVFLSDENASREAGNDKKCILEARPKGKDPIVVTTVTDTIHQSVKIASEKMFLTLEKSLEKRRVQG
ncbi:MAG: HPF/RaiA family ribosome-associated protein [Ferruginibacter sp.]